METMTVVTFASTAAAYVPRPAAPIQSPFQGSGVPAGFGRQRDLKRGVTTAEHDSVMGGTPV